MLKKDLRIPVIAASFALAVSGLSASAIAHESGSSYWGGYSYSDPTDGHVQAEQGHIAREQQHMWHERRARDEALRHGDVFGAWSMQQHLQDEQGHVRREQHHVGHELFNHDD